MWKQSTFKSFNSVVLLKGTSLMGNFSKIEIEVEEENRKRPISDYKCFSNYAH